MNLHKFYYKDYFSGIDFRPLLDNNETSSTQLVEKNNKLCSRGLLYRIEKNDAVSHSFQVRISYPGLVTGVGINHEANIEREFKLGVHFDWTYGMPIVYGSSVKGVLRNAFIAKVDKGEIKEYEGYYLKKITQRDWNKDEIKALFNSIFEGKDENGQNKSIYDRDIFFDAVITHADPKGRILCSDSITPHPDPLKNPIPITFLKIAPGCHLEFRFKLTDSTINGEPFIAAQKLALFKEILTTVGVGAKTNVGYGQLKAVKE